MEVYFAIWQKDEEIFKFPLEDVYDAKNTNIEDAAIEYTQMQKVLQTERGE